MRKLSLLTLALALPALRAEEGMWTFDNLPLKQIQTRFGFTPDQAWLDHARLSSLRFPGGSGSFISADGLVLTNHHVVRGAVQALSTRERDLLKDGFVAQTRDQELRMPGMQLMQLVQMENITERVAAAAKSAKDAAAALGAREREIAKARVELADRTKLTVEPVTLYQGGETWLYVYKTFKDIRLVVAPELSVARFGGDHDNFTYPRHHLDFSMVRVYEDGKPFQPAHFLRWSQGGLKPGDASFITGHPGTTNRLWTRAQMIYARDISTPMGIEASLRRRAALEAFAEKSFEARSRVGGTIYSIDNGLKATYGFLRALKDADAMARLAKAEDELKAKVMADPRLKASTGASWAAVEAALQQQKGLAKEQGIVMGTLQSELLGTALHLHRLPAETALPEAKRLSEYAEAALPALKKKLTAERPVAYSPELEAHMLTFGLQEAKDQLGPQHPAVKALLHGKTPAEVAQAAVSGSKLQDPKEVQRLLDGGAKAVTASTDPMLVLARTLDPLQRALRLKLEAKVLGPIREHSDRIAQARFKAYGKSTYPDATFTLRLSYGTPEGYAANGTLQAPFTTLGGLFDRFQGQGGTTFNLNRTTWNLPARWQERKGSLNLDTPYNFASTHDIIGGNSGSPVIDAKGELVGLAFDSNQEGLGGRYYYDGKLNRTVSVDARAIKEVLVKVYEAKAVVEELGK